MSHAHRWRTHSPSGASAARSGSGGARPPSRRSEPSPLTAVVPIVPLLRPVWVHAGERTGPAFRGGFARARSCFAPLARQVRIAAPEERREEVPREIERPVFSPLEHGPLYEKCTFLSYDAVKAIAGIKHLSHTNDTILDEYKEGAVDG